MHAIKAILFDLDGVLVDSNHLHYESFKDAVLTVTGVTIDQNEHDALFNGVTTKQKLFYYIGKGHIDHSDGPQIESVKREKILQLIPSYIKPNKHLKYLLTELHTKYKFALVSNSGKETSHLILENLGIYDLFDLIVSPSEGLYPKPDPAMYTFAIQKFGLLPSECLIYEDSECGKAAAYKSGSHVIEVKDPKNLLEKLTSLLALN
jgi:HAD superfamily hydrolase (TIGR01509 family)